MVVGGAAEDRGSCWALVRDEDGTHVEGIAAQYAAFCDVANFLGYVGLASRPTSTRMAPKLEPG
jgi:hypothetical protein